MASSLPVPLKELSSVDWLGAREKAWPFDRAQDLTTVGDGARRTTISNVMASSRGGVA